MTCRSCAGLRPLRAYSRCRRSRTPASMRALTACAVSQNSLIRHLLERAPEIRVATAARATHAELAVEEARPGLRQEGRHVHAVGDVADRIFLRGHLRPMVGAQPRGHRAVDAAHAVDAARAIQRQVRHVERPGSGRRARRARAPAPSARRARGRSRRSSARTGSWPKASWPAATGVCVVNTHCGGPASSAAAKASPRAHALAQQLQNQERRVALIHVPDRRRETQRAQRAHAADAQHHLLADAHRLIPAVEPVGDLAILGGILRAVGVEQVHRARGRPAPSRSRATTSRPAMRTLTVSHLPLGVAHRLDRQIARIVLAVLRRAARRRCRRDCMK